MPHTPWAQTSCTNQQKPLKGSFQPFIRACVHVCVHVYVCIYACVCILFTHETALVWLREHSKEPSPSHLGSVLYLQSLGTYIKQLDKEENITSDLRGDLNCGSQSVTRWFWNRKHQHHVGTC